MLRRLIFHCCILLPSCLWGQQTIKGRVTNESTSQAIGNCNIFISNTSRGTVSDNNGYFELNNVPAGKHELVISSIGFETKVISFTDDKLPLELNVSMRIRVKELENVTVEPFEEGNWLRWGAVFFNSFIGSSDNALQCKILNKDSIRFRFYRQSNRLVAFADEPLVIENKALGYLISYQLENFSLDFNQGSLFFAGYTLAQELEKANKKVPERYKRNRLKAYNGSLMHFIRSLYANRLGEEGFDVRRMTRTLNAEKKRVRALYEKARLDKKLQGNVFVMAMPDAPNDSLKYYYEVLRQDDFIDSYGKDLLVADSLLETSVTDSKIFFFDKYLFITYKKGVEDRSYLRSSHLIRRPSYPRSFLMLMNGNAVEIEASGNYFDPVDLTVSGYWGWNLKMGDFLPFDYEPGE